jgi:hypothetical protein
MICLFVFPLSLQWVTGTQQQTILYNTKGQSHGNFNNKKQLAEEMSHQVAYHVILALAMSQQADSHPSSLINLAVAKPKETVLPDHYSPTIAHCVILAIVMP